MELTASVGTLGFKFCAAFPGFVPELNAKPLTFAAGNRVDLVREGTASFLVVDFRGPDDDKRPARVEYWRPIGAAEGGLGGLFVFGPSLRAAGPPARLETLSEAARQALVEHA
jgi:hypothetical protein